MQIQLKQTEIIAALKQYVTSQGINLAGKDVSIAFTAGRKEAGIIADVSIEDISIPGFTDADVEEAVKAAETPAPALTVVPKATAAIATEAKVEPMAEAQAAVAESLEDAGPQPAEAAPAKTTSLFN